MSIANGTLTPPNTVPVDAENIPQEIRDIPRWVIWNWEYKPGQSKPWTKPPYHFITGYKCDHTKKENQCCFSEALASMDAMEYPGVGFSLCNPICGIDLDNCVELNPDGIFCIKPWAVEIIQQFNSYTEFSPTMTGLRILIKAPAGLPTEGKKVNGKEIYTSGRYLTLTGALLSANLPRTIEDRQQQAEDFYKALEAEQERTAAVVASPGAAAGGALVVPGQSALEDKEVLRLLFHTDPGKNKWLRLWDGNWNKDYKSQSEADAALTAKLAFYCGNDQEQVDRLFRQSKLYRDKWDRDDYRQRTLDQALCQDTYNSPAIQAARFNEQLEDMLVSQPDFFPPAPAIVGAVSPPVASQADNRKGRRAYTVDQLKALPRPEPIIQDHFFYHSLVTLFGESDVFKTFYTINASASIATGHPFFGIYPTAPGKVIYICSEGGFSVRQRFVAWERHHQQRLGKSLVVIPAEFDLLDPGEAISILDIASEQLDGLPTLIVIDTLSRNFGAGNESASQDMNQYINSLLILRENTKQPNGMGASLINVVHTGWENKFREGLSSKLPFAMDTRIQLKRGKEGKIIVECIKQKEAEKFPSYIFSTKKVEWEEDGESINSLVLVYEGLGIDTKKYDEEKESQGIIWQAVISTLKTLGRATMKVLIPYIKDNHNISKNKVESAVPFLRDQKIVHYDDKDYCYSLVEDYETIYNMVVLS